MTFRGAYFCGRFAEIAVCASVPRSDRSRHETFRGMTGNRAPVGIQADVQKSDLELIV
jgi:hypothetical protein